MLLFRFKSFNLWFTKLMRPVSEYIQNMWTRRVILFLDDFLLVPTSLGHASALMDFKEDRRRLSRLLQTAPGCLSNHGFHFKHSHQGSV